MRFRMYRRSLREFAMTRRVTRGGSSIEFALGLLVLMPLVLGVGALGVNLIRTQQTVQLTRDAGHMYGRQVDFTDQGNIDLLSRLGASLGLANSVGTTGNALVVLTQLTYVDAPTCAAAQAGNPANGCGNLGKWVFVQRQYVGNTSMGTSQYGNPRPWSTNDLQGVTQDSHGSITLDQYTSRNGAIANFSSANGINPYQNVNGQISGLPSGARLYVSESFSTGFGMPPFVAGYPTYSFAFF
jgi:Flp pilus assembly protein TadG